MKRILQSTLFRLGLIAIVSIATSSGCAIHYYDKTSGTEHLWGFGHLKMAVHTSKDGVLGTVQGTETLGVAVGFGKENPYLSAGWNNQRIISVADNSVVCFQWPSSDFFNVRVGTNLPPLFVTSIRLKDEKP